MSQGTTYYYKVAAVDTSANIGALSDEGSGTPGAIFYDVASPGNKAVAINSGGSIRFGEEALNASSAIIGKALRSWKVRLRRAGTPSGIVLARVRRKSDDAIVATFNESIDSTALGTSFAEYTFTLTSPYTIQNGDRIMIEYGGPASVQIDIWTVDKFDGAQTRRIRRDSTGYVGGNSEDVVGTMSSILPAGGGGDTTPPSKVLGLTVSPISGSQLNLAWTANPEPDLGHYNIYRGTTAGFAVNPATDTPLAQPTTNSYSNTGLTESTTYYYKVAAVDASGNIGNLSDEKSATTLDSIPPAKVLGLTVSPISSSRLDLAWTANTEPDLGHYNIYRGTTAGFAVNPATDAPLAQPTTNSYSNTGLTESTTYYYKVAAVDTSANIGALSDEGSETTQGGGGGDTTPPAKVLGLTVTPISSSRLDLAWTANTEPDLGHYNIYRGTTAGFTVNPATDTPLAQPVANSYSDSTGLTQGTTYYYKVAAVDTSANIGTLSDEQLGTTLTPIFYDVTIPGNTGAALNVSSSHRYGEEAQFASSILIGKSIKSWKVRLRKSGTPSGIVTAKIRRKSDDAIVATFNESIDSTALGTSFAEYTFTLNTAYTIQNGDRIMIEYNGPASVNIEIWNIDKFDGSNTRRIRYTGTSYAGSNTEDVTGTMSST